MGTKTRPGNAVRPSIELLEGRGLLAGNVTALVHDGILDIRGDALDNAAEITTSDTGELVVTGLSGTLVNGQSQATLTGVFEDVRIQLRAGNNEIQLVGVTVGDDLWIGCGVGDNVVILNEVTVDDDTRIGTSSGADYIEIFDSVLKDVDDGGNRFEDPSDSLILGFELRPVLE